MLLYLKSTWARYKFHRLQEKVLAEQHFIRFCDADTTSLVLVVDRNHIASLAKSQASGLEVNQPIVSSEVRKSDSLGTSLGASPRGN